MGYFQMIYFGVVFAVGCMLFYFLRRTMNCAAGTYTDGMRPTKKEEQKIVWKYWGKSAITLCVFNILVQCIRFVM